MRTPFSVMLSCGLALLSGRVAGPDPLDKSKVEQATLQRGNPKELLVTNLGEPLKHPPAQIKEHAKQVVPAGHSWLSWRIHHRNENAQVGPSRSGLVNASDSGGGSFSMGINSGDTGSIRVMFLFAIFDAQDRLARYI